MDDNIFLSNVDKFQEYSTSLLQISIEDLNSDDLNLLFLIDRLLLLDYSNKLTCEQTVFKILKHCTELISGKDEVLVSKLCRLTVCLVSYQHLVLKEDVAILVEYFVNNLQQCQVSLYNDLLAALNAIIYENGGNIEQFYDILVGPMGILIRLSSSHDDETRKLALQGIQLLLHRSSESYLNDAAQSQCMDILIQFLHMPKPDTADEIVYCKSIISCLQGIQNLCLARRSCPQEIVSKLLAALKYYLLFGLAGCSMVMPDILYPTPVNQYRPIPPSQQPPFPWQSPSKSGNEDGTAGKSGAKNKKSTKKRQTGKQKSGAARNLTEKFGNNEAASLDHSALLLPTWSTTISSDSEWSDADLVANTSGATPSTVNHKVKILSEKIRLSSVTCMHTAVKVIGRRVMYGYWTSLLPDTPSQSGHTPPPTLFTSIMKDPSQRVRLGSLTVLFVLFENSKQFLMMADDSDAQRATFTPFSVTQGHMIKEVHRNLSLALAAENLPRIITQILKCFAVVIQNVPYQRLKPGLLSRVLRFVRQFINHKEPNIRVACLTCLGSIVNVSGPSIEVWHLLQPGSQHSLSMSSDTGYRLFNRENSTTLSADAQVFTPTRGTPHESTSIDCPPGPHTPTSPYHSASSGAQTPIASGLQTPVLSKEMLQSLGTDPSWVIKVCVRNINPSLLKPNIQDNTNTENYYQPIPVRLASLQLLACLAKQYIQIYSCSLELLRSVIETSLSDTDLSIQLHAAKLLEEVGSVMLKRMDDPEQTDLTLQQVVDFWSYLLGSAIPLCLQSISDQRASVCVTICNCMTNIGHRVFEHLSRLRSAFIMTVLLGLASTVDDGSELDAEEQQYVLRNDQQRAGSEGQIMVQAAAISALGVLVLFPSLREDVDFVSDVSNVVIHAIEHLPLSVKVNASWSLGNIAACLVENRASAVSDFVDTFCDKLLLKLFKVSIKGSYDNEKVRSSTVRAIGNLTRYLSKKSYESRVFDGVIGDSMKALNDNIVAGTVKVRWNACYAVFNMYHNDILYRETGNTPLLHSLSKVVVDCKNLKVRINASSALGAPNDRCCYASLNTFMTVCRGLIAALTNAQNIKEFSELRYKETLIDQICNSLVHMMGMILIDDVVQVGGVIGANQIMVDAHVKKYLHNIHTQTAVKGRVSRASHTCSHLESLLNTNPLTDQQRANLIMLKEIFVYTQTDIEAITDSKNATSFQQTYD